MNTYDCIIVGSGIAGLYTALLAKEVGSVLVLTKGGTEDCNTRHAQGGIAAAIGKNDSSDLHFQDTIAAGDGLCDIKAVQTLVDEAPDRIADLIKFGVPFDTVDGQIALTKEAAHTVPRILHAGGDATGEHIEVTLSRRVRMSSIKVMEHCLVTEIVTDGNSVTGIKAIDSRTGSILEYKSRFIILATGGAGRLFQYTTNSEVATGDGIALAYAAGAEIEDMEFFQFHPTVLRLPGVPSFLISEAVRGEGGLLCNVEGYRFMPDYTQDAELAPRDIVARSIVYEMNKTNSDRVFLDVTHLSSKLITARFPHIYRFCLDRGLDITKGLIPVAPAAHYLMGGVRVNTWGETNIAGLFAAGEVACTGVHGANRLASNALLEVVVFSKRIIEKMLSKSGRKTKPKKSISKYYSLQKPLTSEISMQLNLPNLEKLIWDKVGIVRTGEGLREAAAILASWQKHLPSCVDRATYELYSMLLTARLMTEAALFREESRGAHFRSDFPNSASSWQRHIVFRSL